MTPNPAEFVKVSRKPGICFMGTGQQFLGCAHVVWCVGNQNDTPRPCDGDPVMFIRPDQINRYIKLRLIT